MSPALRSHSNLAVSSSHLAAIPPRPSPQDATHKPLGADFHFEVATPARTFIFRIDRSAASSAGSAEEQRLANGKELAGWISALELAHCGGSQEERCAMVAVVAVVCGGGVTVTTRGVHARPLAYAAL